MRMGAHWVALAALAVCFSACGGDDAPSTSGQTADNCEPGAQIPCDCEDGSVGSMTCSGNPAIQGSCRCGEPTTVPDPLAPTPVDPVSIGAAGSSSSTAPVLPGSTTTNPMTAAPTLPVGGGLGPSGMGAGPAMMDPVVETPSDRGQDEQGATAGTTADDDGDDSGMVATGGLAVPEGEHCAAVADWDDSWSQFEEEVLLLSNEARAVGHNCDTMGEFGPTEPLTMSAALRCSARLHALDMGENDYFDHNSQDGTNPFERIAAAGYSGRAFGENIALGQSSPQQVVDGWLDSDGHCSNLMSPNFTEIGVGFWRGDSGGGFARARPLYWVQNFGTPGGRGRF